MLRKFRRPIAALLSAGLLVGSVGAASAAPSKSFDVEWCFEFPSPVAIVTWSGYRVNQIRVRISDQTNFLDWERSIEPAARAGTERIFLGIENDFPYAGIDLLLNEHVWASDDIFAPDGLYENLPPC